MKKTLLNFIPSQEQLHPHTHTHTNTIQGMKPHNQTKETNIFIFRTYSFNNMILTIAMLRDMCSTLLQTIER